jgi:hypothetical protein
MQAAAFLDDLVSDFLFLLGELPASASRTRTTMSERAIGIFGSIYAEEFDSNRQSADAVADPPCRSGCNF